MSSVTDSRPLRELIAEAKAEVTEEIEDSKEEEEEEEEPETPVVATFSKVCFQRAQIDHLLTAQSCSNCFLFSGKFRAQESTLRCKCRQLRG